MKQTRTIPLFRNQYQYQYLGRAQSQYQYQYQYLAVAKVQYQYQYQYLKNQIFNTNTNTNTGQNTNTSIPIPILAVNFTSYTSQNCSNSIRYDKRRPGDIAQVYSNTKKFQNLFKWKPKHNNINKIIKSAINWEKKISTVK